MESKTINNIIAEPTCSAELKFMLEKFGYEGTYTHGHVNYWMYCNFDCYVSVLPDAGSSMMDYERIFHVCIYRYYMNLNVQPTVVRNEKNRMMTFMKPYNAMDYGLRQALGQFNPLRG